MTHIDPAYLPGPAGPSFDLPHGRYLPPVPSGAVRAWLAEQAAPGDWVLDPFSANPIVALEAAQAGCRVLAAVNNPIARFMLEMLACAAPRQNYDAALADLAAARKGDQRLEHHLQGLYETPCPRCDKLVTAQAFIWERGAAHPTARLVNCPFCGEEGEHPVVPADLARLADLPPAGLHRARALERIAPLDDPLRPEVEEALNIYLPRALYVLFTVINKLEGPSIPAARKALLTALLLIACDDASSLWPHPPAGRVRPRQLSTPLRFRENNLWLSLLEGAQYWQADSSQATTAPLEVRIWPDLAPPGSITLFPGRLKDLAPHLADIPVKAVAAALPRPNSAYWTLSAMWTGWLWGREAAAPLRSVLGRKRYDWAWHMSALQSSFECITSSLPKQIPVLGFIGEAEPAFVNAALAAAEQAGLGFSGLAQRSEPAQVQIHWTAGRALRHGNLPAGEAVARAAVQDTLCDFGEPVPYLVAHCAVLSTMAHEGALVPPRSAPVTDSMSYLQGTLRKVFSEREMLVHYGEGDTPETGSWWLRDPEDCPSALADRVEMEVQRKLQQQPGLTLTELDHSLVRAFPGTFTPAPSLVQVCLDSYGVELDGGWRLRPEDNPTSRKEELKRTISQTVRIGQALGYRVEEGQPILWIEPEGEAVFAIYVSASSLIGKHIFQKDLPSARSRVIVLPGGRSNLLAYKLARNPRLSRAVEQGWHFLKFRHLRQLASLPELDPDTWTEQLNGDPPEYHAVRLQM